MIGLLVLALTAIAGTAFAQTMGSVESTSEQQPDKDGVPPGGCMPIGLTASGEIVFPFACKALNRAATRSSRRAETCRTRRKAGAGRKGGKPLQRPPLHKPPLQQDDPVFRQDETACSTPPRVDYSGSRRIVRRSIGNFKFPCQPLNDDGEGGVALLSIRLSKLDALTAQFASSDVVSSNHTLDNDANERLATAGGFFHRRGDRTFQDGAFNSVPSGRPWRARYWIERENLHVPSRFYRRQLLGRLRRCAPIIGHD